MNWLFGHWSEIEKRLSKASSVALFLDFDGTLAKLQERPEHVHLGASARRTLLALVKSSRIRVWIVSGRRRADVRALVRAPGIQYLGLHGWEGPARKDIADETKIGLACLRTILGSTFGPHQSIWIEDKQHAFTIHYGPEIGAFGLANLHAGINRELAAFPGRFRLEEGKRILEVLPAELENKGVTVMRELESLAPHALAVYVGDDSADEAAFAALRKGITVKVGRDRKSKAEFWLGGVHQVRSFLIRIGWSMKRMASRLPARSGIRLETGW